MTGYIIQIGNEYVNWYGLLVNDIKWAHIFSTEEDAILTAQLQTTDTKVLEYTFEPTYHEYHRNF